MPTFKSSFLRTLEERGFIHQISDGEALDAACVAGPITAYIGFDATATSLHAGSLIQIMLLYWLQQTGHRPITLMGGGTSMIGDPSFKDESRKLLTAETIGANIVGIQKIFAQFLRYGSGPTDAVMANNADWLMQLNYVEFLRDVGRHFSVNRMLSFDSVKLRLDREQSLSFLEFNYMILQGYDFVELSRRYGCTLQMGGSDQWGNIVNGVDLSHRMGGPQLFALTSSLLTTSSGAKMGKTASGAIWLNPDLLSPYDFWQYWRNTEDADVERFFKLYTPLSLSEIASITSGDVNEAKKALATAVTTMVHGRDAAVQASDTARATFEQGAMPADLPTFYIDMGTNSEFRHGRSNTAILAATTFVRSMSEARRNFGQNSFRLNGEVQTAERIVPWEETDPKIDGFLVQFGQKKFAIVKKKTT
ncbi:MAG: tyrosine--tRNA ligase [Devosia sp.]